MGKRTKEKTDDEIRRKIKRLEKELTFRQNSPTPYQSEDPEYGSYYEDEEVEFEPHEKGTDSDGASKHENSTEQRLPASVVEVPASTTDPIAPEISSPEKSSEVLQEKPQGEENPIPLEVLAILGEAKQSEETFGKNIPAEISARWGKILLEGLIKDQKENLLTKTLIPGNFQLAKAAKLYAEVASVLNEPTKNRDKRLEKMQNQLGCGIAGLANLTAELIGKDLNKIDIIKQIAEINQILLDLHYEETMNRRRLIIPMLDKSFITIIQGVKRETFLFGDNLNENIRTTKSLEKFSLQIKKSFPLQQHTPRRPNTTGLQGNARALPRQPSGQGAARAPHAPARYYPPPPPPAGRRAPPATRRGPPPPPQPNRAQDRRNRR